MSQNNMLTSPCYRTEVILSTSVYMGDSKFSVEGKDFYVPIVCFNPQGNIVKILGLKHDEIVLVSCFQYFEQIQRKVIIPKFFGCVKMLSKGIIREYGYVSNSSWHSFGGDKSDENSLIINTLRNSEDNQEEKVKTITEREELGISADRVLITVNVYYPDEHEGQKCQEVLVFLLKNGVFDSQNYDHRITTIINENLGDNWLKISWTNGLYSGSYSKPSEHSISVDED